MRVTGLRFQNKAQTKDLVYILKTTPANPKTVPSDDDDIDDMYGVFFVGS